MTIKDSFYALMSARTTEQMIWEDENGPRPTSAFATLQITPARNYSIQRGTVDDEGNRTSYASRVVQVQAKFFGPNAWARADTFAMALQTEAAQDQSESLNIGILSVDRIQSVPSLVDGAAYEDRAIVDLTCHYLASIKEATSYIETVQGTGQANDLPAVPFSATTA